MKLITLNDEQHAYLLRVLRVALTAPGQDVAAIATLIFLLDNANEVDQ